MSVTDGLGHRGSAAEQAVTALHRALAGAVDEQVDGFRDRLAIGAESLWRGRTSTGLPQILPCLFGRRRDRVAHHAVHGAGVDPGLYGPGDETAAASAVRALLWIARQAPAHPVRLTAADHDRFAVTYHLPGRITVTSRLPFSGAAPDLDSVLPAGSFARAVYNAPPEAPAVCLDSLVLGRNPGPESVWVPQPHEPLSASNGEWRADVPLASLTYAHSILPRPHPGFTASLDLQGTIPGSVGPAAVDIPVDLTVWEAIGWLDPFASDTSVDPNERILVVATDRYLTLQGRYTTVRRAVEG